MEPNLSSIQEIASFMKSSFEETVVLAVEKLVDLENNVKRESDLLKENVSRLEEDKRELENEKKEADLLIKKQEYLLDHYMRKCEHLEENVSRLEQDKRVLEDENRRLELDNRELEEDKKELSDTIIETENGYIKVIKEHVKDSIEKIQSQLEMIDKLKGEKKEAENKLNAYEKGFEDFTERVSRLERIWVEKIGVDCLSVKQATIIQAFQGNEPLPPANVVASKSGDRASARESLLADPCSDNEDEVASNKRIMGESENKDGSSFSVREKTKTVRQCQDRPLHRSYVKPIGGNDSDDSSSTRGINMFFAGTP